MECGHPTTAVFYRGISNIRLSLCKWCDLCGLESIETLKLISFVKEKAAERALLKKAGREIAAEVKHRELWRSLRTLAEELTTPARAIRGPRFFLPIAAERGTTGIPWTTLALIAITLSSWALSLAHPDQMLVFALSSLDVRRGQQLYQLVSHALLHAGALHLFGNMLFLWLFGPAVEERLGGARFVGLYFLLAAAAAMGFVLSSGGIERHAVGASGAISGVMGAYLVLCPSRQIRMLAWSHVLEVPAFIYLGVWFAMQVLYAALSQVALYSGNIAWSAHVAGFAAGVGAGLWWRRRERKQR